MRNNNDRKTQRGRGSECVRWKDNSISPPSSEMGDTARTGLPHPKQNRTEFDCLYVNVSGVQEASV